MKTTVNELMLAFHNSVNRLIDPLQQVRLLDEHLSGYDGSDAIFQALYREIVENSIRWSLPEAQREAFALPEYGMHLKGYTNNSYIRVEPKSGDSSSSKEFVFVQFVPQESKHKAFSMVEVSEVNQKGVVLKTELFPFEECHFLCLCDVKGGTKMLDQIDVSV